jgi:hypothetical protein
VKRPSGTRTFFVAAVVHHNELQWELRAIRWRLLHVAIPSWLRVTRVMRLPAFPGGASMIEARRRGDVVDFRATVPSMSRQVDLGQLRDAIWRRHALSVR